MIPAFKKFEMFDYLQYSNDDLLQDTLSIDFEILHATLFGITI